MALPERLTSPAPMPVPARNDERPPRTGWYWNSNQLVRGWLPLLGPEGIGLLDFYLAMADHRPGAQAPGWTAVTLDELARLTGWGRARLVRLNRQLCAAGLLEVRHLPVPGRGPAVRRALYRVCRQAALPAAATLRRLADLAADDPTLAARLRRYHTHATPAPPPTPSSDDSVPDCEMVKPAASSPSCRPTAPAGGPPPVSARATGPVSPENRSVDMTQTDSDTRTSNGSPGFERARATWEAANSRPMSCLEQQRLAQLAAHAAAGGQPPEQRDGWEWVADAIVEAVDAGSAFVAPRRVARILERWLTEGRDAPRRPRQQPRHDRAPRARSAAMPRRRPVVAPATSEADAGAPPPAGMAAAGNTVAWQPPDAIEGLPAAPAAVLRAAMAAAGIDTESFLRGAALAGWADVDRLVVATPAPLPPVVARRLAPRLAEGVTALLGRPVVCHLVAASALTGAKDADGGE